MIELLQPIFDFLVIAMLVRLVWRLVTASGRRTTASGPAQKPAGERVGGALVLDPQCGTYVSPSRAVRGAARGEVHYFCSVQCRDAYASGPGH